MACDTGRDAVSKWCYWEGILNLHWTIKELVNRLYFVMFYYTMYKLYIRFFLNYGPLFMVTWLNFKCLIYCISGCDTSRTSGKHLGYKLVRAW